MTGNALPFDVPAAFGRFRVLHQIGAGSLGPVFRGEDTADGRSVAIKVLRLNLPPERADDVADGLRALAGRLPVHSTITPILDTGIEDNNPYLVTPIAPGQTLSVALRQFGPADIADAVPRLAALAASLDLAAESGTWHGALHPRDILIADDQTSLINLGIAPIVERTGFGLPVRRPYTAPEVVDGGPTSPASDLFALAAIAFEWLFGRRARGPADTPLTVPALPGVETEALSSAFTSALALDPAARFESCSAFVSALAQAVGDPDAAEGVASAKGGQDRIDADRLPLFVDVERAHGRDTEPLSAESARPDALAEDDAHAVRAETKRRLSPVHEFDSSPADDAPDEAAGALDAPPAGPMSEAEGELARDAGHGLSVQPAGEQPAAESSAAGEPMRASVAPIAPRARPAPRFVEQKVEALAWQGTLGSQDARNGRRRRFGTGSLVAALLVGVLAGGGIGSFLAGRVRWGSPAAAPGVNAAARETPSESTGRGYTDAALPSEPARPQSPPPEPAPRPPTRADAARGDSAPASREVAVAPESGRLLIRSSPTGAEVLVNGVRRGQTPLAVRDLPLGTHTVLLTRPGYARAEHRIALTDARPSRSLEARLVTEAPSGSPTPRVPVAPPTRQAAPRAATGSLVVESRPPGARVLVDGREVGTTPVTLETIAPGVHAVRLERDGYQPWATSIRIGPGERARVAASLVGGR